MMTSADLEKLTTRLAELEAEIARLGSDFVDLAAIVDSPAVPIADAAPAEALLPLYSSLDEWVEQYFLVVFARPTGGELRWCAEWREHPEAVTRLEALWRSWEAMRMDANLGIASWLVSYLDPLLAALLGRQGTFASCSALRHGASVVVPTLQSGQPISDTRDICSEPTSAVARTPS